MCPRTRRRDHCAGASGRSRGRLLAASAGLALSLLSAIASADEPGGSSEPAPGVSLRIGSVRPGTSVAIESTVEEDDVARGASWVGIYAVAAIPVGAIVTSIGWGLFAHNRRLSRGEVIKERRRHDDPDTACEAPSLRVGIAPGPQGVAGALTLSF